MTPILLHACAWLTAKFYLGVPWYISWGIQWMHPSSALWKFSCCATIWPSESSVNKVGFCLTHKFARLMYSLFMILFLATRSIWYPKLNWVAFIRIGMGIGGCNWEERMVSGQVTHYLKTDPQLVVVLPTVSLVLGNTICWVENSLTASACSDALEGATNIWGCGDLTWGFKPAISKFRQSDVVSIPRDGC